MMADYKTTAMSCRFRNRITVIAALACLSVLSTASFSQFMSAREFRNAISVLEKAQSDGNLELIASSVETSAPLLRETPERYLEYMYKVCGILSSYKFNDSGRQTDLLNEYAVRVLTQDIPMPVKTRAAFSEFLVNDPEQIDDISWTKLRFTKARLWLETWNQITASTDLSFDPSDLPLIDVQPPAATGLPAGSDPKAVGDTKLRVEYETTIEKNRLKSRHYDDQVWLRLNSAAVFQHVQNYLAHAYSRPPFNRSEIVNLVSSVVQDADSKKHFLVLFQGAKEN